LIAALSRRFREDRDMRKVRPVGPGMTGLKMTDFGAGPIAPNVRYNGVSMNTDAKIAIILGGVLIFWTLLCKVVDMSKKMKQHKRFRVIEFRW
jgi:hypothetical protein